MVGWFRRYVSFCLAYVVCEYESNSNTRIRKDLVKNDMYLSVVGLVGDGGGGYDDSNSDGGNGDGGGGDGYGGGDGGDDGGGV